MGYLYKKTRLSIDLMGDVEKTENDIKILALLKIIYRYIRIRN